MLLPIANVFGVESWLIFAAVVLVLFGGKKIPELMRGVGQGVGELKKGLEEGQRQFTNAAHHEETPVVPPAPSAPASTTAPANTNTTTAP